VVETVRAQFFRFSSRSQVVPWDTLPCRFNVRVLIELKGSWRKPCLNIDVGHSNFVAFLLLRGDLFCFWTFLKFFRVRLNIEFYESFTVWEVHQTFIKPFSKEMPMSFRTDWCRWKTSVSYNARGVQHAAAPSNLVFFATDFVVAEINLCILRPWEGGAFQFWGIPILRGWPSHLGIPFLWGCGAFQFCDVCVGIPILRGVCSKDPTPSPN
jgi:hypothetical protein